jgi:hypothetical protein
MFDVEKDIEAGLSFLNLNINRNLYSNYSCAFCRTNENIDEYFSFFPINDGTILTVAGSGDHVLQATLEGAKNIHVFDKNIFSLYLTKLKVAACKGLKYHEFINYFYGDLDYSFYNKKYYKIIRKYLDNEALKFWDAMYYKGNFYDNWSSLFLMEDFRFNNGNNSFRKEDNYKNLKNYILDVSLTYYQFDLFELENYILENEKFDAIFLSNIYDWIKNKYGNKKKYEKFIKEELIKYLNDSGMIAVYVTACGYYDKSLENRFKDVIEFNKKDKVIIYKKTF